MKTTRRLLAIGLATFFLVVIGGSGLLGYPPTLAQDAHLPVPDPLALGTASEIPAVLAKPTANTQVDQLPPSIAQGTGDPLQVEPVTRPDNTLPTPYPEQPDGTLRLPSTTPEAVVEEAVTAPDANPADVNPADPNPTVSAEESLPAADTQALLAGLSPEMAKRSQLLIEADRFYIAGDHAAAEPLYRRAKDSKWLAEISSSESILPMTNPEDLPPAGQVYWREAQAGAESEFSNRVLVPLELLVKEYPEFLPAQSMYARYLVQQDRAEEAEQLLEVAVMRYPYHPDLLQAQAAVQMAQEKWIEAAITANQFALLNPEHPDADAMAQLAQENLDRFRGEMNATLTRNLVSNIITGAAGYFLTGGLLGPFTALNSGILMMQGESGLGQQVAEQVKRQLPMVDDPEIRTYVNEIGQKLAALTGRNEFNYSFDVVMDDSLNAFALPGGKIFIHAGAITKSNSEAELAGLIGHEISHAVLSHGFQMVTQGNLTASLASFIPIPEVANIAANLIVASYSRDMERQADILGTKILSTGRYAADGLHNLMATLEEEYGNRGVTWFASHPNPSDRISYLKRLVDEGGFNRYAYEGVEQHLKIRQKTMQLINQYKLEQGIEAEESIQNQGER